MASLEVLNGKSANERVELEQNTPVEIGTKRKAALRLRDTGISYTHAVVTLKGALLLVEDRRSRGGTFVGDVKLDIEPAELADGGTFKLGEVELRFSAAASAPVVESDTAERSEALERVERERDQLGEQNKALGTQVEELQARLTDAEHATSDLIEQSNAAEDRCSDLSTQVTKLDEQLGRKRKLEEELKQMRDDATKARQDLAALRAQITQTEERLHNSEAARQQSEESYSQLESKVADERQEFESELREARREARQAAQRARNATSVRDERFEGIGGSSFEEDMRATMLDAFTGANFAAGGGKDRLATIKTAAAAAAREIEDIKKNGVKINLSIADLETMLRDRDQELGEVRDEYEAKCNEVDELNEDYQETLEELERSKS